MRVKSLTDRFAPFTITARPIIGCQSQGAMPPIYSPSPCTRWHGLFTDSNNPPGDSSDKLRRLVKSLRGSRRTSAKVPWLFTRYPPRVFSEQFYVREACIEKDRLNQPWGGLSWVKACEDAGKRRMSVSIGSRNSAVHSCDMNKLLLNEFLSGRPSKIPTRPSESRRSHRHSDLRAVIFDLRKYMNVERREE